jgi:hypothetical protein
MGAAPHRPDLAVAEHSGDRQLGEAFAAEAHIPIGLAVEAAAAAQAGEQQGDQGFAGTAALLHGSTSGIHPLHVYLTVWLSGALGTMLVFSDNNLVKLRRYLGTAGCSMRP